MEYDNYYFTEQMNNKDISFDYKIKKDISTSKNAIKLLDYISFPKEIVNSAFK
jgi:DNA mismatch repair ATPase MutS